jgi:hypothetical protein
MEGKRGQAQGGVEGKRGHAESWFTDLRDTITHTHTHTHTHTQTHLRDSIAKQVQLAQNSVLMKRGRQGCERKKKINMCKLPQNSVLMKNMADKAV